MKPRSVPSRCVLDIEHSPASLHAHAVPLDVAIRPGDVVTVHGVPAVVPFNTRLSRDCRATVRRAGPLRRLWTRTVGVFAVTALYEVGFEAGEPS